MSRRDLFNSNTAREAARERAAVLKARVSVVDLARHREAWPDALLSGGYRCACPACGERSAVHIADDGRSWRCRNGLCGASGDLITFEMAATGRDFAGACAGLEAAFPPEGGPDGASGDLFAAGGGDV